MFIDTNVFVSARNNQAAAGTSARSVLARVQQSGEALCLSRQVMREYLSAVTRPQTWWAPLPMSEALKDISWLGSAFEVLEDGPRVTEMLAELCRDVPVAGKQIHDTNIVATMLAHGERRLLTFNATDFRRYGERIEVVDMGMPA